MSEKPLTINTTAKKAGIGVETIRYYQRIGLINKPEKPLSGYRVYSEETVSRLRFIQRAKELGFSLAEVTNLLVLGDGRCMETKELVTLKRVYNLLFMLVYSQVTLLGYLAFLIDIAFKLTYPNRATGLKTLQNWTKPTA